MKVPKRVDIVGTMDLVRYQYVPAVAGRAVRAFGCSDWLMTVNEARTVLFLFKSNPVSGKKQIRIGDEIMTGVEYRIPDATLKKIGIVTSIQYSSDWYFSHEMSKFEHEFKSHPAMYADKKSRFGVIAIKHARGPIMNDDGVTG